MVNFFKISRFFLYLAPLAVAVVTSSTLFPFIVGKYVWFRVSVDLALIFFLLGLLLKPQQAQQALKVSDFNQIFKNPLVIALTVFVVIFLLACFFSIDPKMSFWSNFERGEGGFQMLHLWLFFILLLFLFKNEKDWQKLFKIAVFGGVLMAFYGFLAGLGQAGYIGPQFGVAGYRFQGSIGNPAYVASYSIFMFFYVLYLLFSNYKQKLFSGGAIFWWLLLLFFLVVFWLAATRGAFVGLIAAIVFGVGYFIYSHKNWRKWLLIGLIFLILIISLLVYFRDTPFVKKIPGSRIFDVSLKSQNLVDRTMIWQMALAGWKERPILGWGPENFIQVFDRHYLPDYWIKGGDKSWFDRAHSIYFDYLVETGILGLISFISIFLVFYWQLFKKIPTINNKPRNQPQLEWQKAWFLALPIAYLVQGIVLFDVLPIYLNLFLFLAFASYKFSEKIFKQ